MSNIAFVGKVLEKVAVRRLLDHLTLNGLHEEYQSAYKILHSTETALLRVQHDIASELDKNRAMLFVMLDLSRAFDKIDHEHLLTLLQDEYGELETALSWFRTYLEDRTHCVQVDSKHPRLFRYRVVCHMDRSLGLSCSLFTPRQCSGYSKDIA